MRNKCKKSFPDHQDLAVSARPQACRGHTTKEALKILPGATFDISCVTLESCVLASLVMRQGDKCPVRAERAHCDWNKPALTRTHPPGALLPK